MAKPQHRAETEIGGIFRTCRSAFVSTGVFSFFINLLMLTGPLFMLQVYDRVLTSGSIPTLVALVVLVVILYGLYGFLEFIRARVLVRIGRILDESLRQRVFDVVAHHALVRTPGVNDHPTQDLMTVRQFISGPGPFAFLDMPWAPIYLAVIFLMHWLLGVFALIAVVLLACVAVFNELLTRMPTRAAQSAASKAAIMATESRHNVEVASALGMLGVLRERWSKVQSDALDFLTFASDRAGAVSSTSRTLRLMFQSGVLAVGAYLVVNQEISPGTMIAASIIMSRALAPVEQSIAHWQSFLGFRSAIQRLNKILVATPQEKDRMALPEPTANVVVQDFAAFIPGVSQPIVAGVSFTLKPGDGLGIIGPTGAGKSTLARALVGVWPHFRGEVRLDGATLAQWDPNLLGHHIGYLPQEVELFDGTISDNISRFYPDPDPEAVIAAARAANVHNLILQFDDGYNTLIGEGGVRLSAGQRQRIGLARTLYGDPALLVLDEPNANLDAEGEAALIHAMVAARKRGAAVVVVAHRPSAIAALDSLMMIKDGRPVAYGPKDQVLEKVLAKRTPATAGGGRLTKTEANKE